MKIKNYLRAILIPFCWLRCFSVQRWPQRKRQRKVFCFYFLFEPKIPRLISTLPVFFSVSSSSSSPRSLYLPRSHFLFFCLTVTLKVFLLCLFRHTELSVSFSLPSLPLFSLAGSVSLPRDSPVLCSRYRPIDFGRERKYRGHDSPCMNLMIPVLSVPSFQWRREQINHKEFFITSLQACQ